MPVEKLTKHKLAQIILMLIILLIAFVWGTINKTTHTKVICAYAKKCYFRVNDIELSLLPDKNSTTITHIMGPVEKGWYVSLGNQAYYALDGQIALSLAVDDQPTLYINQGQSIDFSFEN